MSEGFKFFESVHTRKVATKIFNIANLRDILYFKLATNNRTHQRSWKTDKKGKVIQVRFLGDFK